MGSEKNTPFELPWVWFVEFTTYYDAHIYGAKSLVFSEKTKYQNIEVYDTIKYGKMLVLDGRVQSSLKDEFIYHESLVHPAMIAHPNPRRVLVAGGGEGATIREILKHPSVERVVAIEIDEGMVRVAKELLKEWHQGALDNEKVEIKIMDARKFIETSDEMFDVIIIDLPEPVPGGPAVYLYTKEFYEAVRKRLEGSGIMVTQAESADYGDDFVHAAIHRTVREVFPIVRSYIVGVPSFDGVWSFVLGSLKADPKALSREEIDGRIKERGLEGKLRHYDGETHLHMFSVPKPLRDLVARCGKPITDSEPLVVSSAERPRRW